MSPPLSAADTGSPFKIDPAFAQEWVCRPPRWPSPPLAASRFPHRHYAGASSGPRPARWPGARQCEERQRSLQRERRCLWRQAVVLTREDWSQGALQRLYNVGDDLRDPAPPISPAKGRGRTLYTVRRYRFGFARRIIPAGGLRAGQPHAKRTDRLLPAISCGYSLFPNPQASPRAHPPSQQQPAAEPLTT
jgi:hypothetical protein